MLEYVESVKAGGGWLSDLELWECVWDFKEACQLFGFTVLNHWHRRAEKQELLHKKLLEETLLHGGDSSTKLSERAYEEVEKLGPFGTWTCLGILPKPLRLTCNRVF
jgi:hypothetical protein